MGWASGSRIFTAVIKSAKKNFPDSQARYNFYKALIPVFEDDADCDTLNECLDDGDPAFNDAFQELNPDYFEEEEEE